MNDKEIIYTMAMQKLLFNHPAAAIELYRQCGSAEKVYEERKSIDAIMPDATAHLKQLIDVDWTPTMAWAEQEAAWCKEKHISMLTPNDEAYPTRLNNCPDAPLMLFFRGNTDLNAPHAISIVGTRQSTEYGRDSIHALLTELKECVPDLLVVSGLAYGIDVEAHKEALDNDLPTVGVVAHGLDTIYPAAHRNIASRMVNQGGVLTEYTSKTRPDRQNFLRRNRIVAGMTDATIVVESKEHGGSLFTARVANEYNREVFAVPGRICDQASAGCNALIRDNKAQILTSAKDIVELMGWHYADRYEKTLKSEGIQTSMFNNLTPEEKAVVAALDGKDMTLNELTMATGINVATLNAMIFKMEMDGILRPLAGNKVHLVK